MKKRKLMNKIILFVLCYCALASTGFGGSMVYANQPAPTPPPVVPVQPQTQQNDESCSCPDIEVHTNLESVKDGDTAKFWVEIDDENLKISKFDWKVKNGVILSGQGTSEIIVRSKQNKDEDSLEATVILPVYTSACLCEIEFSEEIYFDDETVERDPSRVISCDVANMTALFLDKEVITQSSSTPPKASLRLENLFVSVKAVAIDPEGDPLTYKYIVSGGHIIGDGPDVKWDLSGVEPGTYTITGAVDDGCGFCGQTITRVVTISDNELACSLVDCPEVTLTGPATISDGSSFFVTANVVGGAVEPKFTWSVENGEIIGKTDYAVVNIKPSADVNRQKVVITMNIIGFDPIWSCITQRTLTYIDGKLVSNK